MAVDGDGVAGSFPCFGQALSGSTPTFDLHSAVLTGASKNESSLTEIVCFSRAGWSAVTELTSPVSEPSSSLSMVCRSIPVNPAKKVSPGDPQ
jgi:hypothetical protein